MRVTNMRPWAVEIPAVGVLVEAGGDVDVDDEIARSLCEQPDNWQASKPAKNQPVSGKEG